MGLSQNMCIYITLNINLEKNFNRKKLTPPQFSEYVSDTMLNNILKKNNFDNFFIENI